VLGKTSSDSWAASFPVTAASLKLKKLLGVADLTFAVSGKAVGVGSMVTSVPAVQDISDETPLGLSLDLAADVVPGVSAGLLWNAYQATNVGETWDTAASEVDVTDPAHVYGMAVYGGYKMAGDDMSFGLNLYGGAKDINEASDSMVVGLTGSFGMKSIANLAVNGEFSYLGNKGMAYAAKVGASIMGIAPTLTYLAKNDEFGGNDSWKGYSYDDDTDSITDDAGLMTEFNSTDAEASALAIASPSTPRSSWTSSSPPSPAATTCS